MEQAIVTSSTSAAAPSIRETRAALGMGLFLLALSAAYVALFILYGTLRSSMPEWPPRGMASPPLLIPAVNMAVVLACTLTMRLAVRALARHDAHLYGRYLLITANLGALFVLLDVFLARQAVESGIIAGESLYASLLFALTGFHAVHFLVGVLAAAGSSFSVSLKRSTAKLNRARLWGLYWQFSSVTWALMLFLVFAL